MLEALTSASKTALTTLAAVKIELDIDGGDEDDYLNQKILQVTDDILDYLNVVRTTDGQRTIASQQLRETFNAAEYSISQLPATLMLSRGLGRHKLALSRFPVRSITSIVESGTTLTTDQYQLDQNGILTRLSNSVPVRWADAPIVVTYTAGWIMPGQTSRDLPYSIEGAVFEYINMVRSARGRDPLIKSENVNGILDTDYWVGQIGTDGSLPPSVAARLDRYRRTSFGAG